MSENSRYSEDEQWLKDNGSQFFASDDNTPSQSEGGSSSMQSYLKALYRLNLLSPEDEHATTSLLRELEDRLTEFLHDHGVPYVALRSEGVEQRGSTGAYDHGLILAKAEEMLAEGKLNKRDTSKLTTSLKKFRQQRRKLVQCNLRLVIAIAKRFRNPSVPFIDLIQEGNVGLLKAIERFKPKLGYRFSTYAYWWIQQEIQLAIRRNDDLVRQPANVQDDLRSIYRAIGKIRASGQPSSDESLSQETGLDLERIQSLLKLPGPTSSLDEPLSDEQTSTRLDYAPADETYNTDEEVSRREIKEKLREAVAKLPARQRTVLNLRYGLESDRDCSFRVIGEQLGLSQERARQLHTDALRQLRRQWRQP